MLSGFWDEVALGGDSVVWTSACCRDVRGYISSEMFSFLSANCSGFFPLGFLRCCSLRILWPFSFCRRPACPGASTVLVGAAASVAIAVLTDGVFGSLGGHVFAAKVALCSSLGVCVHYAQTIISRAGGGSYGRSSFSGPSSPSGRGLGGRPQAAGAGTTGGSASTGTAFTAGLSALYCAGLFSNSFIEAEDGLHRFLGASSLLSLSVLILLSHSPAAPASGFPNSTGSGGDRLGALLGLSPTSTAVLYAALAAAFLRAAAGVQDVAAEAGVSTEAAYGFGRSLCPLPALWWLCRAARGGGGSGSGGGDRRSGGGSGVRGALSGGSWGRWFDGALQAVSLAAVGVYWLSEAVVAAGQGSHSAAAAEAGPAVPGTEAGPPYGVLPPLRLLLPRAVYLLCLSGLVAVLLRPPARRVEHHHHQYTSKKGAPKPGEREARSREEEGGFAPSDTGAGGAAGDASSYARALAVTSGTVVSHLLPVVVLLLGPGSPAVVAFVAAACGCALRGCSLAAPAAAGGTPGAVRGVPLGAVAVAWSVVGRAFFFLTGHHNQFSRLQYSAAFVGE